MDNLKELNAKLEIKLKAILKERLLALLKKAEIGRLQIESRKVLETDLPSCFPFLQRLSLPSLFFVFG